MSDPLASRVSRIVSGSVHALLGALESSAPELVLEQAIREVDAAVQDVRGELGRELATKHLASTRLREERQRHEELAAQLQFALGEEREDLAEAAAARQLDIEAQLPVLERALLEGGERQQELESFIRALQARQREMAEELRQFRATRSGSTPYAQSGAAAQVAGAGPALRRAEQAASAFERVLERSTGLPARAGERADEARLAELEALERHSRIRERVAAAKTRRAQS
jgi:phage shock protein A